MPSQLRHGTQFCGEIFLLTSPFIEQLSAAKAFHKPIVTKIAPLQAFYQAEDYHQDFLIRNPTYPYIVRNDLPKIDALRQVFPKHYRETPVALGDAR